MAIFAPAESLPSPATLTLAKWGVRGVNIGEQELVLYKLEDVPLIMKAFRMAGLKEVLADLDDLIERGN